MLEVGLSEFKLPDCFERGSSRLRVRQLSVLITHYCQGEPDLFNIVNSPSVFGMHYYTKAATMAASLGIAHIIDSVVIVSWYIVLLQ